MATILVVEDDRDTKRMLKIKLGMAGHKVIEGLTLRTAQKAIDESEFGQPRLAIVDVYLLGTSEEGIKVCRWAKEDLKIPVIAMSAFLDQDVRQEARAVSDAILRKPEDLQLIIPTIERLTAQGSD